MSENTAAKSARLLVSGRVHVPDVTTVVVDGDTGRHVIERHGETWECDCLGYAYRHTCSHLTAVVMLTRPPEPTWSAP